MKFTGSSAAIIGTLALHGALITLAANEWLSHPDKAVTTAPILIKLMQTPPLETPKPYPPTVQTGAPAKKNQPVTEPAALPIPAPPLRTAQQTAEPAAAPVSSPSPAIDTAPIAAPQIPALAPAKTGVSIPASYAATNRKPDYPIMSRRYGEQGTVMLRALVKPDGSAGTVEIKVSSGYPLLDESARTAVQGWRFDPATVDGKPIPMWHQIPIPFTLQN